MERNREAVLLFERRADEYQARYMNVGHYAAVLDDMCRRLPENATILEIACGPGNITRYMLDKRPDLKWLGTDLSPRMLQLAMQNNPEAEFKLMDGRLPHTLNRHFDAVVCGFFLPYLSKQEVVAFISDVSKTLKPGGFLYLSTMEDRYEKSGYQASSDGKDKVFVHYHEGHYLAEALHDNGYKLLDVQRIDFEKLNTDLVILAEK